MVGIYLFLAQAFSNTVPSGLSYAIKYPLIQHRSQPIQTIDHFEQYCRCSTCDR